MSYKPDPRNENDFDAMLENALDAMPETDLPPEDVVAVVNPWKKAMHRVLIGLAISTVTLNFWCLNYLLPAVGFVLMLLGFRTMRRENGWFKGCYAVVLIRCIYYFPTLIVNASIFQQAFYASEWMNWLTAVNLICQFLQLFFLWRGIKAVQRKAELEERAGGAVGLMIWLGLICPIALLPAVDIVLFGLLVIFYILAIRSLWRTAREMDEAGYLMEAAPVCVPDGVLAGLIGAVLAVGIALAYLFCSQYPMDWQPLERTETEEISEIRAHLVSLGFPEEILGDLTEEDLLECRNATRVVVTAEEHPVGDGRFVQESKKGRDGYIYFEHYTVYDAYELTLTGIAVELSAEGDVWKLIHHFRFTEHPGYYGTECIQLWTADRNTRIGWGRGSGFSGSVLYDEGDVTYTAPYYSLTEETYDTSSIIFGSSVSTDVFAEFSLPNEGENPRGYVAYTIFEKMEGAIVDSWINFTHRQTWADYPSATAKQHRMTSGLNADGPFKTIQDAIQFFASEN